MAHQLVTLRERYRLASGGQMCDTCIRAARQDLHTLPGTLLRTCILIGIAPTHPQAGRVRRVPDDSIAELIAIGALVALVGSAIPRGYERKGLADSIVSH